MVTFRKARRLKGAFAVEALGALALLALLVGYVIYNSISSNNESLAESAATHHQAVARGASLYVRDNYNSLVNQLNAGGVKTVSVSELKAAGYLPNGLSAYSPLGQELELKLKKGPSKNPIEGLVVSKGGEPIDLKLARLIAEKIGADGGYTVGSGDYCGARVATSDLLCGTNGVWEYPSSEFNLSGRGTGYIASALFFKDGMQLGEYLYRKAVPGKEELNQMDTYLRMGDGAVAAEGASCSGRAIALSQDGHILSCHENKWKKARLGLGEELKQCSVRSCTGRNCTPNIPGHHCLMTASTTYKEVCDAGGGESERPTQYCYTYVRNYLCCPL